ncbi:unnamed protein product [Cochlearia groenlandica]
MTKSFLSYFYFFTCISLLLLLAASSTTTSTRNTTSGLSYGRCAPGDIIGECLTTVEEEEEAVVRRILQQRGFLTPKSIQKQPTYICKIAGNCIGIANRNRKPCPYYGRCRL